MNKRITALVAVVAMLMALIGALPTTAYAATGMATIDVSLLGATNLDNSGAVATDSQWNYVASQKALLLTTDGGNYTLTGSNPTLSIQRNVFGSLYITLDNVSIGAPLLLSAIITSSSTITLVGASTITGDAQLPSCTITGSGSLTVTATGTYPIYLYASTLSILGSVTVAAIGTDSNAIGNATPILIGDNASLTMGNGDTSDETHTFTSEPPVPGGPAYRWVVTGTGVTFTGNPTDPSIDVTIPFGTTGTVSREPIPVAPIITSPNKLSVVAGTGGSLPLTATGYPAPTWSLSGAPAGVGITGSTLTVASTVPAGTYTFSINATNGVEPDATQSFTLTVTKAGGGNGGNGGGGKLPPTGDALSILAPVALLIGSLATLSLTSDRRKRR